MKIFSYVLHNRCNSRHDICILPSFSCDKRKYPFSIIFFLFSATLGSFGCGTGIAWSSPVLPKIKNESCYEKGCDLSGVSDEAADWIGPLFPLGAIFAGPLAFFLLNKIGRKKTLLWLSCPMLIGKVDMNIFDVVKWQIIAEMFG